MSKKIDYYNIIFHINYDPIEELYYCGVPGYSIPTIFVGKSEKEVQDSMEDLLTSYLDFCHDQGSCRETEITYNVMEAYSTGWIIREAGSKITDSFEEQKEEYLQKIIIKEFLKNTDINDPYHSEVISIADEQENIEQVLADLSERKQLNRMEIIQKAKEAGHSKIRIGEMEVLRVNRLGISPSDHT
ncbi:MAG: hypothetical protein K1000chlam3_00015 [Chlamydiae bacterium]|nr:hypothetical protein [Chlamydiota bacterium]